MNNDFDKILDDCIDRINNGQSIDECLKLYPKYSEQLEPLLKAIGELHTQSTFTPGEAAKAQGRLRLHNALNEIAREHKTPQNSSLRRLFVQPRLWAPAAAMLLVLAIGLGVGLFAALNPSDVQALQGTLQNIDSVSGTVTVKLNDGNTKTFNFTDVSVTTISQALGSASLEIGDHVTIKQDKQGEVKALKVRNADVEGTIRTLSTDSMTITIEKKGEVILRVTPETVIRIKDKDSTAFSDLQAGQKIEASYDVVSKKVLRINVNMTEGEIRGIVKTINTNNKTVTLNTGKLVDITLQVTPDTRIRIGNKGRAAFSDLRVGQNVQAKYDVVSVKALNLVIAVNENKQGNTKTSGKEGNPKQHTGNNEQNRNVSGTIKTISADNKMITLNTEKQVDITLQVTPDTRIRIGNEGKAAFSDDLRVGQNVQAGYDTTSMKALTLVIRQDNNKHREE